MGSGLDIRAKSQGPAIFKLNVCLIVLSSIVIIGRLYARGFMTKALGVDDILAVFGFVRYLENREPCFFVITDISVVTRASPSLYLASKLSK